MPKEKTHLRNAMLSLNKLKDNSPIKQLLVKHYNCFLLGSVAHDSLFYLANKPKYNKEIKQSNNFCHDGDTLSFFNRYTNKTDEGLAFLFGSLSHYFADITFHPFIFYFTGSKQFTSNFPIGHLKLETTLDQLTEAVFGKLEKKLPAINPAVFTAFNSLHYKENAPDYIAKKALTTHLQIYKLLHCSVLASFFSGSKKESFYPKKPIFNNTDATVLWYKKHLYLHPVLGDELEDSFDSLLQKSSANFALCVEILDKIYPNIKIDDIGSILDTGLVGKTQENMVYFNLKEGELLFTC